MLRAYIVYIATFAALILGLWIVLRVGKTLRAPGEIAGDWQVQWETASPSDMGFRGTMQVDQSGRYCTFRFDEARTMSLTITGGEVIGASDDGAPLARLEGEGYEMTLHPTAIRDAVRIEIAGPEHYRGLAERVARPSDTAAASAAIPLAPVADARP